MALSLFAVLAYLAATLLLVLALRGGRHERGAPIA